MAFLQWGLISYTLILISILVSLIVWQNKHLMQYGFHLDFYQRGDYWSFMKQIWLFQFIHGDILHLVMNCYFLYIAGPVLESSLWVMNFLIFFLSTTIVSVFGLYFFAPRSNTIGISGFCMALLSYLWITLYMVADPWASRIATLLVINIAFWFVPGISFVGHATGAIWGIAFWYITQNII